MIFSDFFSGIFGISVGLGFGWFWEFGLVLGFLADFLFSKSFIKKMAASTKGQILHFFSQAGLALFGCIFGPWLRPIFLVFFLGLWLEFWLDFWLDVSIF